MSDKTLDYVFIRNRMAFPFPFSPRAGTLSNHRGTGDAEAMCDKKTNDLREHQHLPHRPPGLFGQNYGSQPLYSRCIGYSHYSLNHQSRDSGQPECFESQSFFFFNILNKAKNTCLNRLRQGLNQEKCLSLCPTHSKYGMRKRNSAPHTCFPNAYHHGETIYSAFTRRELLTEP